MKITNRSAWRLPMLLGYGAVILSMLACAVLSGGAQVQEGSLQLDNGVVKVKTENGDWAPVAGKATFELTGKLESTDPWKVAGTTLETNEMTQIEDGLQVGDMARVRGAVLENDTWVAYSIERTEEQTEPVIILIGVVDSVTPWVVNGITLNVTDETDIQGEIKPGTIVRVKILLMEDGTWKVVSIAPLGTPTETSGCVAVVATVVNVSGNEIQFLGWPSVVKFEPNTQTDNGNDNTDENENENGNDGGSVGDGDVVAAVICISDDGSLIIVQITILDADEESGGPSTQGEKVLVCHKPGKKGGHTLSLPQSAVPAHLAHGDTLGACP